MVGNLKKPWKISANLENHYKITDNLVEETEISKIPSFNRYRWLHLLLVIDFLFFIATMKFLNSKVFL